MRGCMERIGPDDRGRGEFFAAQERDRRNLFHRRQNLSQVKNAAKKAGLLIIVFVRACRLEP